VTVPARQGDAQTVGWHHANGAQPSGNALGCREIACICDGNRRWIVKIGLFRHEARELHTRSASVSPATCMHSLYVGRAPVGFM